VPHEPLLRSYPNCKFRSEEEIALEAVSGRFVAGVSKFRMPLMQYAPKKHRILTSTTIAHMFVTYQPTQCRHFEELPQFRAADAA
jgi:hypothetical protein